LIEGASEGAGLGIRFLKHLTRNRILLHIVDVAPLDESDPAEAALSIVRELERFSPTLAARPRWLVLNKTDLLSPDQLAERRKAVLAALAWTGPVYEIAAITRDGTGPLSGDLMTCIEAFKAAEADDPEALALEREIQTRMQQEARDRIESLRSARASARKAQQDQDLDDDAEVDVEYRH
jgi:GTP-binding protein